MKDNYNERHGKFPVQSQEMMHPWRTILVTFVNGYAQTPRSTGSDLSLWNSPAKD